MLASITALNIKVRVVFFEGWISFGRDEVDIIY